MRTMPAVTINGTSVVISGSHSGSGSIIGIAEEPMELHYSFAKFSYADDTYP